MNIFEKASKLGLRFQVKNGMNLLTEDLWNLPLTSTTNKPNLNDLAKGLSRKVKLLDEEDFVGTAKVDSGEQLQFEIVKHVIASKMEENKLKSERKSNQEQRKLIIQIMAEKKNDDIKSKTFEELEALLNGMD